jgi:hypothetical protein
VETAATMAASSSIVVASKATVAAVAPTETVGDLEILTTRIRTTSARYAGS